MRRNQTRAQQYGQIYKIVMDLFDKVTSLLVTDDAGKLQGVIQIYDIKL